MAKHRQPGLSIPAPNTIAWDEIPHNYTDFLTDYYLRPTGKREEWTWPSMKESRDKDWEALKERGYAK